MRASLELRLKAASYRQRRFCEPLCLPSSDQALLGLPHRVPGTKTVRFRAAVSGGSSEALRGPLGTVPSWPSPVAPVQFAASAPALGRAEGPGGPGKGRNSHQVGMCHLLNPHGHPGRAGDLVSPAQISTAAQRGCRNSRGHTAGKRQDSTPG